MIIDDADEQLQLMKSVCAMINPTLHVITSDSGDAALRCLRTTNLNLPKVILLDLRMPGKSGQEVLSELKADPLLKRIPVCIFSNADLESEISDCYERGASVYFRKPIGLTGLKQFLEYFNGIWFTFASHSSH
jgi:CheY-like chemotaxis protein